MSREQRISRLLNEARKTWWAWITNAAGGSWPRRPSSAGKTTTNPGAGWRTYTASSRGTTATGSGPSIFCLEGFNHYVAGSHAEKMAHSLRHVADVPRDLGDREGTERDYESVIEMYRNLDPAPAHSLANALRGFAMLLERTGKRDEALQAFIEAHRLYLQVGNAPGISEMGRKVKQLRE